MGSANLAAGEWRTPYADIGVQITVSSFTALERDATGSDGEKILQNPAALKVFVIEQLRMKLDAE
jgi:hypothetical protein